MSQISWDDFQKVELRIGTIIDVGDFPEARKPAWKLTGTDEATWEFKRTAEAGLVNTGKRIAKKIRPITGIAKRFWNSVIGF